MDAPGEPADGRVLVLAPVGRDAALAARVLGQSALAARPCADAAELCREIGRGAAVVLLAEEALTPAAGPALFDALAGQPPWSDLPLVVLTTRRGRGDPDRVRLLRRFERLRNVTFLERPARVMTLVSAVRAAADARRRQYQVRDLLAQLEERVRQRDDLLAMLGHELRNPLGPLRNALEIVARRDDDAATRNWARGVFERQVTHLTRIVDDVLEVSRLARGKIELRTERVDLAALVRWIVEDHRPAFDARGVALRGDVPPAPAWVDADPTRITQVVGNLLHNAAKYTDRGGAVRVWLDRDPAGRVWVAVRDTGVGLDPDVLPHVFEAFVQGRQNLDRGRGGLGLGLTMVAGLVRLHGGEVRAASDGPGTGSEFRFGLPLAAAPAAAAAPADRAAPAGLRVLIIEDHADAAESLRVLLELDGHEASVAATGAEGVAAAARFRPDVVICDIGLPGMDGYAVVAALRRHPATAAVPVIALSGYAQQEDRDRCRAAGFTTHLAKPVEPDVLRDVLAACGGPRGLTALGSPLPDAAACG